MSNFSLKNHYDQVLWKETLQVNGIRGLVAATPVILMVIWGILTNQLPFQAVLSFSVSLIFMPITIILFGLFLKLLNDLRIPFSGIIYLCYALPLMLADPIVYFIHRAAPSLVPIERYEFVNFHAIIFVLKTDPAYLGSKTVLKNLEQTQKQRC